MCFEEEDFMFFAAADDGAVEGKTLIGMASCWSFAKDQCR